MIVSLSSLEELYKKIEEDRYFRGYPNVNRFPVRFIHLNSFRELREVFEFLTKKYNVKYKDISEFLHGDNWLTSYEIVEEIKRINDNTIVVSLSEYLRFEEDLFPTLKGLAEIEKPDVRIYIPLVGLWERFEREFWNKFYRREEWVPVWKLETSTQRSITLYQINFNLNYRNLSLKDFIVLPTAKDWLGIWRRDITEDKKGILLMSKPLSYLCRNFLPDRIFDLKKISNEKEFLERVFKIKIPIEYKEEDRKFWNKLIEEIDRIKGTTIERIFLEHFNLGSIKRLKPIDFLELYLKTGDNYERWLIKNFFLSLYKFRSSYLYICFNKLEGWDIRDLIEKIWLEVFNLPPKTLGNMLSERKEFLNYIHKNLKFSAEFIEEKLTNKLTTIEKYPIKKKFRYLTGITFVEKRFVIEELKDLDIQEIQEVIPDLKEAYIELAYYLDWDLIKPDNEIDNWIIEYFKEYNYSKLKNTKSSKLEELINTKNRDKSTFLEWYYSIPKAEIDENCECFWIDGLGAEWFPLIVHLINRYCGGKKSIKKKLITRVNLPSITKCNRYEGRRIEDLDRYIHGQNPYRYPDDLINEIDILKNIVEKIVMGSSHKKICIVSDHGFSFLCTKNFNNIKRLNISNSEHEGRYMWVEGKNYSDDVYYMVWKVDEGPCQGRTAIVALKHVSLGNTPRREVHGGATLEEVLVPYILIEFEREKTEYRIEAINPEVWITNPVLKIKISPEPLSVPEAFLNERPLKVSYNKEGNLYLIDLRGLKVGEHRLQLKIGDKEYQIDVSIKGGFKERDLL